MKKEKPQNDSKQLSSAIEVAAHRHSGQVDRAGRPYILHCIHVMNAMAPDVTLMTIGVLHDICEDTDTPVGDIYKWFGAKVGAAVEAISKVPGEDLQSYLKRVKANPEARKVKLADLLHNMEVTRLLKPLRPGDMDRFGNYLKAYNYLAHADVSLPEFYNGFRLSAGDPDGMPCQPGEFVITEREADTKDFGSLTSSYDGESAPRDGGCGAREWESKPCTPEVLAKYGITEEQYQEICDALSDKLSHGSCGNCI